jgi:RNA polymerase sigma-70 factor (ECF subfamily)
MEANLEKMVNRLPEQRRKIFLMSKKSGLTNNEIAFQLNLSRRTVENQLYRAISYLKEHFKNELLLTLLFCFPVTH